MGKNISASRKRPGRPPKAALFGELIADIWKNHPDFSDRDIEGELRIRRIAILKAKHEDWTPQQIKAEIDSDQPSPYTIGEYRRNILEPNREAVKRFDELWSVASLVEYPMPPELVPLVLTFYREGLKDEYMKLTIREVQWVMRLHKAIDPSELWEWAWAYAKKEWLSDVTSQPFDTTELDEKLLSEPGYARQERVMYNAGNLILDIAGYSKQERNYGDEKSAFMQVREALNERFRQIDEATKSDSENVI